MMLSNVCGLVALFVSLCVCEVICSCLTSPLDVNCQLKPSSGLSESIFYAGCPRELFDNVDFSYARLTSPPTDTSVEFEQNGSGIKMASNSSVSLTLIIRYRQMYEQISILPLRLLANHYVVTPLKNNSRTVPSALVIVGTHDNTAVTVFGLNDLNQTSFTLDDLMTRTLHIPISRKQFDARILSNRPVAVFMYTYIGVCTAGLCSGRKQNMIVNQLLPTKLFGNRFIIPKISHRGRMKIGVKSSESWTTVTILPSADTCNRTFYSEFVQEYICNNQLVLIQTDTPSSIVVSSVIETSKFYRKEDSFIVNIPDVDKYKSKYVFTIPEPLSYLEVPSVNTTLLILFESEDIVIHLKESSVNKTFTGSDKGIQRVELGCRSFIKIGYFENKILNTGTFELYEENGLPFGAMLHYADKARNGSEFGYWLSYENSRKSETGMHCDVQSSSVRTSVRGYQQDKISTTGKVAHATSASVGNQQPNAGNQRPNIHSTVASMPAAIQFPGKHQQDTTTRGNLHPDVHSIVAPMPAATQTPASTPTASDTLGKTREGSAEALESPCRCENREVRNNIGPWQVFGIVIGTLTVLTWACCCCFTFKKRRCKRRHQVDPEERTDMQLRTRFENNHET